MEDGSILPLYVDFYGYRLSAAFGAEQVKSALEYKPTSNDIFVVTYPKCGTTWVQHILYLIFNKGEKPKSGLDFLKNSPFLEMLGAGCTQTMKRPGAIKSHMPFSMIPYSRHAKYIYVSRNPKDCCASFYHHTTGFSGYKFTNGTFDVFFDIFCKGETDFGDYFDHILSWYERRNDPNVLFLHYEEMKDNLSAEVLKIAEFLGERYHKELLEEPDFLQTVVKRSDVSAMVHYTNDNLASFFCNPLSFEEEIPEGLQRFHKVSQTTPTEAKLVRKGVVGDYRNYFTPQMNEIMNEMILRKLKGTEFIEVWGRYGIM